MKKVIYCVILSLLLSGCSFGKKPAVVDPCAKAPKQCWYSENYKTPDTNPTCLELMKCFQWSMTAN